MYVLRQQKEGRGDEGKEARREKVKAERGKKGRKRKREGKEKERKGGEKREVAKKELLTVMKLWGRGSAWRLGNTYCSEDRHYHFKLWMVHNSRVKCNSLSYLRIREREKYEIGNFKNNQGKFVSLFSSGIAWKMESYCSY